MQTVICLLLFFFVFFGGIRFARIKNLWRLNLIVNRVYSVHDKILMIDFHETGVQYLKTDKVLTSVVNSGLPLVTSQVIQLFTNNVVTSRVN